MFKYLWMILSMLLIMQLHGMDDSADIEAVITTKCEFNFFSKLPDEICDLIAQYLIFNDIENRRRVH